MIFSVLLVVIGFGLYRCVEPYKPEVLDNNPNYLVVDAFLDVSLGGIKVNLTRTTSLSSSLPSVFERDAIVELQEIDGKVFLLNDRNDGSYYLSSNEFAFEQEYRIRITTQDGKVYESTYIKPVSTPEIDTVTWMVEGDFLNINVSTSGANDQSRYYRWKFTDTYEYHSPYVSPYSIINGKVVPRAADEQVFWCWKSDTLKDILIGNTVRLSQNVIDNYTLLRIPKESIKISRRYSILVEQQALSHEAYDYWVNVRRINENLGGLNDPLPGNVVGNISCVTDPRENVIGMFEAGEISTKRVFVSILDLPDRFSTFRYPTCTIDTIYVEEIPSSPNINLIEAFSTMGPGLPEVYAFSTSSNSCTDCRVFGQGQNLKPSFWKD